MRTEDGGRRTEDVDLIPNLLGHLDELFLGAVRNSFAEFFCGILLACHSKQTDRRIIAITQRISSSLASCVKGRGTLQSRSMSFEAEGEDVEFMSFQAIIASV